MLLKQPKFYRELFSHSRVWLSMVAVGIKLIMIPINGIGRALDALNVLHDLWPAARIKSFRA